MKSFMRALVVVLAGAILAAGPAYAKKDKGAGDRKSRRSSLRTRRKLRLRRRCPN